MTLNEIQALEVGSRIHWFIEGEEEWGTIVDDLGCELEIRWDGNRGELVSYGIEDTRWANINHYPCGSEEVAECSNGDGAEE